MYTIFGMLTAVMSRGLQDAAIPTAVVARKLLGPLMILISLALLGIWRPRAGFGHAVSLRLREMTGAGRSVLGGFLLGVAFAFAFCPTLALLFFGYVIPMTLASNFGPLYPAVFALGTTVPLVVTTTLVGGGFASGYFTRRIASWEPWLRRLAAGIFLLMGINDTVLYWFI